MSEKATYIIDLKDAFSPKLKTAYQNLDGFENKLGKIAGPSGSGGLLGAFGGAAARAFAPLAIAAGLVMFTGKIITLGAEMEQTKVAMEVLVGDAEKANKLFSQMNNFANITPFANKDIIETGKLLLSFGTKLEDVMPTVSMLGDISGGSADKLHMMSLAFAQMSSAGRLMGQDLLQMINAGFNPLKVISEKTGKSMGFLKEQMEKGRISAEMVKQAFVAATSEGGLFFGMMDKQSKTMAGMWSTFTGTIEHAMATIGMKWGPTIVKVISGLNTGLEMLMRVDFTPLLSAFGQMFDMFSELGDAFGDLFDALGITVDGMTILQRFFDGVSLSIRGFLLPIRLLINYLTIVVKVADNVIESFKGIGHMFQGIGDIGRNLATVFKGIGMMLQGVMTNSLGMIKGGFDFAMNAASQIQKDQDKRRQDLIEGWGTVKKQGADAMKEAFDQTFNFAQKEAKSWSKAFGTPDSKKEAEKVDRFSFDKNAFGKFGAGKDKDKFGRVDGEVRSGGVKNIVINITQLVGEIKFESFNKLSENQLVEAVKRALMTAVNDANVAIE